MKAFSLQEFSVSQEILAFIGLLFFSLIITLITQKIIVRAAHRISKRTANKYDDLLSQYKIYDLIAYILGLLVIYYGGRFLPTFQFFLTKLVSLGWIIIITLLFSRLLSLGLTLYEKFPLAKRHPIKGYVELFKLFLYAAAVIIGLCDLLGRSPWALLSGLGALSAVLLLIFRHTLLSFVASFQIISQDLFHIGDWIEMPQYGADGEVIDIALHTIKIQNWDKTIVVIPTYKFLEESFKNWRGMKLSGARRIKRAILIDQASIKFCDQRLLERLKKIALLRKYIEEKLSEIEAYNKKHGFDTQASPLNGRRLTNIGVFRIYLERYLQNHPSIRKDMTLMVRQLAPTSQGLPLEIYCFVADTRWVSYERVQSDIFDHVLAASPEFELRIYQMPTGYDLEMLGRTCKEPFRV